VVLLAGLGGGEVVGDAVEVEAIVADAIRCATDSGAHVVAGIMLHPICMRIPTKGNVRYVAYAKDKLKADGGGLRSCNGGVGGDHLQRDRAHK